MDVALSFASGVANCVAMNVATISVFFDLVAPRIKDGTINDLEITGHRVSFALGIDIPLPQSSSEVDFLLDCQVMTGHTHSEIKYLV